MTDLPPFFYANSQAYKFVDIKRQYCQLHGEFIGFQVFGNKIKTSGRIGSSAYVFRIDSLDIDCRLMFQKYADENSEEWAIEDPQ